MLVALASCAAVIGGAVDADQDDREVLAALAGRGVGGVVHDWRAGDVDWSAADAVLVRSTWDHTDHLDEFLRWTRLVEAAGTPLFNSAEVCRWNTHKRYLIELEERGAPIVPTAWLAAGDRVALADVAAARGWHDVVAKPAVGAGARGLVVARADQDPATAERAFAGLLATGDVMVQPLVPSVVDGELSVVVVDGDVSHAVRKVPAADDVRVQIEFGGTYLAEEPDADAAALATWLVESTGHDVLYARVDLLADDDGSWMLGELELVEPSLLLPWSHDGADRLVDALLQRLGAG